MSVVYAAYEPELDRKVALKLIRTAPAVDAGAASRERLLREAQAMAKVSHPNVVHVYDVGVWQERVFVAMELVDGETLRQWMRRDDADWQKALALFIAAGRGLAAAHAVGLVHRDFKPDNVLVGRDGRVRVANFGLARPAGGAASGEASLSPSTPRLQQQITHSGALDAGFELHMRPGDHYDLFPDVAWLAEAIAERLRPSDAASRRRSS